MKMKEKGFTLVELLTVFAILSIILGMVVVNVNNYSSKQREKDYENLVKIIEENAKVLVNKNEDLFVGVTNNVSSKVIDVNGNTLNGCKFSYDLLVDNKLMDEDTVNPVDNKAFYNNNYSIITTLSDKGTYNYELKQNVNDDYTNCRDIDNISIENMNLALTSTSNSVTAKVTVSNTLDFIRRIDWTLYDEDDNKLKEVSSENLIYNFGGLKSNKLYKVKAKLVSITNKYQERIGEDTTLSIINPYITIKNNPTTSQNGYLYSQTLSVTYNGGGIALPTYYIKSTKNGNINVNLNMSCGNGSMPSNCTETQSTNTLNENIWYQVPKNISISYDTETDKIGTVYAVTFDGNNYSSSITATLDKIDRTPPACSWSGESTIWTNSNRTITATCNDSKSGCTKDTAIKSWSYTSGTTKEKNLSYTIKDNVGNTATCSKTANIYVDKEAPTCSWSGESTSWTRENRTITATCNDSGSGCDNSTLNKSWSYNSGEKKTDNLSYEVKDNAGNKRICNKTANVYVDKDAPTCTSSGGSNAWTNDSRTLVGTCSDSGSGCKGNVSWLINWEGNWENLSPGRVYDNVDNYVDCPANQIVKIDKTPPTAPTTMNFMYSDGTMYSDNTWTNQIVYAGKEKGNPDPTGATDNLSGICKYQISPDNNSWLDYNYNSGLSNNDTIGWYKLDTKDNTYMQHNRYFRAVDCAGNYGPSILKIAKITKEKPDDVSLKMENYLKTNVYYVVDKTSYTVGSDSFVNSSATFEFKRTINDQEKAARCGNESIKYCVAKNGTKCTPNRSINLDTKVPIKIFGESESTYDIYYQVRCSSGQYDDIRMFRYKIDNTPPNVQCNPDPDNILNFYKNGYFQAICSDNFSKCIYSPNDLLYSRFGPRATGYIMDDNGNAKQTAFANILAYPGQDLENGGLLLNSSGGVQYRNPYTSNPMKIYASYIDHAGNSNNCYADVTKRK